MFPTDDEIFRDREHAGLRLAEVLSRDVFADPLVLALPRGGVPVAEPVARSLSAPLDVFVARKVGAPGHQEYGIGAVTEGSERIVLTEHAAAFGLSDEKLDQMAATELEEVVRRVDRYRGGQPLPDLSNRSVILVDDGLATGVTAEAALRTLGDRGPGRLVLAVPVCAVDSAERLGGLGEVVCVQRPPEFRAVGMWYRDFGQTTDEQVIEILDRARAEV